MISNNPFVDFYKSNNISPVHQDISNIEIHIKKREKLYRTLGLCPVFFKNKEILEVGPGGGYNSLAFFIWGCSNMIFVEPNPRGCKEIPDTLSKINVVKNYQIFPSFLEEFDTDKEFDIIIAEGFIPGLNDRTQILSKLKGMVLRGGIVIVTCMDEISYFFEHLKRLIASKYLYDHQITNFSESVEVLSKCFLPFHKV